MKLVDGTLFNWRQECGIDNESILFIAIGFSPMYGCNYHVNKKILSIFDYSEASDWTLSFYCETQLEAEKIVMSVCSGNNFEIMPAYRK